MEKENKKLKDEITLKHLSDDFVALNRNGADLYCPFVPPMPYQQKTSNLAGGQVQVGYSHSSCTSLCPLFKIIDGGKSVILNCGATVVHAIDKIIPIEDTIKPKEDGKIISLNKDVN